MNKKHRIFFKSLFLIFLTLFILFGCSYNEKDNVSVHFIDVGQGDCTLIELPENKIMLIDAGDNGREDEIIDYIDRLNIKKIDYLVATHPHSDHIGGMKEIIENYEIGEIYMPNAYSSSKTFEDMLDAIDKKNLNINSAYAGEKIFEYSGVRADILSPQKGEKYSDLNNSSVVIRLKYKETGFLFMGDAEKEVEEYILENYDNLKNDVLKTGHHGSSTSSGGEFIGAVEPEFAVISCGAGNEYGHPHKETLKTLKENGAEVLRTDKMGTIIIKTNGENLSVER